jgi:translation elongation factor EF-4
MVDGLSLKDKLKDFKGIDAPRGDVQGVAEAMAYGLNKDKAWDISEILLQYYDGDLNVNEAEQQINQLTNKGRTGAIVGRAADGSRVVIAQMSYGSTYDKPVRVKSYSRDIVKDKKLLAKKPGKRLSKTGNVYYEYRANRSDKNQKERL